LKKRILREERVIFSFYGNSMGVIQNKHLD